MIELDAQVTWSPGLLAGPKRAVEVASMRAVNYAAKRGRTAGSREIYSQIAVPAAYINQQLKVTKKATRQKPEAIVGARQRPVRLARFGARQVTRRAPAAWGDPLRGIPEGRAQAGVSVKVKRTGRRKTMKKSFLIPLKQGRTGGYLLDDKTGIVFGIFRRVGTGRKDIVHLSGPSVDQLFKRMIQGKLAATVSEDLVREARRQLDFLLNEAVP